MSPLRFLLVLLMLVVAAPASAQEIPDPDCSDLGAAQERYDMGRFEEAIRVATGCLESGAGSEEERQRAYRLVGLSYIGQDLRNDARSAVLELVQLVPNYEPDPVNDPPLFIELVEEAQAELAAGEMEEDVAIVDPDRGAEAAREAEQAAEEARREAERREAARRSEGGSGITKWLLIGGAVVGGGVLAAVLLSGGDDGGGGGIPTPPLPPNQ